ncbi:MAG: SpoIIE family protein phosphatase [Clostridia bacterium]|nr:SpoIIE family protein phosphatase [Clostridia bacterium]
MDVQLEFKQKGLKDRLRGLIPGIRKGWGALLGRLPMAGAFFLLSLAQCFSVPSPFALCCLTALLAAGEKPKGALLGLGAGLLFRLAWHMPMEEGLFAACLLCFPVLRRPGLKRWRLLLQTGGLLVLRSLPNILRAQDSQTVIFCAAGILLGIAVMPALLRCGQILHERKGKINQDDVLCLLLPGLLFIAGAGRLWAFQMNLGYICSVFLVIGVSWLCGSAVSVCLGLGCGLALLLSGQSALLLVNLAFGGLLAGFLQGKKRLLAAGLYCLAAVTDAYLIAFSFLPAVAASEALGGLIFCLIPNKWMNKAGRLIRRLRWSEPRENAYTRLKMQRWVRAIDCMADALPQPRIAPAPPSEESEALTETLCADCDRLPICWHEQYGHTKEGMEALAERGEDTEEYLRIINRYFSACPRISRLPGLLARLDEDRQDRLHRAVCAAYERDMLQTHLTALSQAAQRISLEGMSGDSEESYWMLQAEEALQTLRFPGQTAFVKRVDGRMTVCLKCEPLSLRPVETEMLANQLTLQLRVPLAVTEQQSNRIVLEEEPPLRVITGMATACAVAPEKKRKPGKRPDNGDAVLTQALTGGRELLALSDGMGHGTGAQDESRKTLELLSLCMEAGYTRSQAMTAVNGAMLSATGGEKFATVDLCLIDLWTGETAMNKLGACPSFILQGQKIHTVEGAALPLGIIEHVVPMEHTFTLGEGDTLLLMSDGISEAFEEEESILELLHRCREEPPQKLADSLLREALMQRDGLPPDDMTVLCARVTERQKRGRHSG